MAASIGSFGISESGVKFVPLLFAGDINVYSVARAFHEAYGVISKVYGKYPSGPCVNSDIIDYSADEGADEPLRFRSLAEAFAQEHKDERVLLVPCGDSYAKLAASFKDELPENVTVPCIEPGLMERLVDKEKFYLLCDEMGIDHPATFVHVRDMGEDFELPFGAPYILKPSSGVEYWKHPFAGQKKVYKLDSLPELKETLSRIYGAGYDRSLIIQEFVPGDDSAMRVLTSYSDRKGKVVIMCLGHVLLEEHTPHGIGNHAVIITEPCGDMTRKYRELLESIGYTGWSNFDIKYDSRDGKFKAFEINTRQGRSNYYVTASGANVARFMVRDRLDEMDLSFEAAEEEILWMVVPRGVAFRYVNGAYRKKMKDLIAAGKVRNPLLYSRDSRLKRRLFLVKNLGGHFIKYRKYMGKP